MAVHGGYYSSGISGSMGGPFTTYTSGSESYRVHTFLSSGIFKTEFPIRCDIFIVGGGGGGSQEAHHNGGGGAGGAVYVKGYNMPVGSHTVTVGAGNNAEGADSCISASADIIVGVGGGAGSGTSATGFDGGSGGGSGYSQAGTSDETQSSYNTSLSSGTVTNFGNDGAGAESEVL